MLKAKSQQYVDPYTNPNPMKQEIFKLVSNGYYKEALLLYSQLHSSSIPPNKFTFPFLFKACAKLKSPLPGRILHSILVKTGFLRDAYAATALTNMYMNFQQTDNAVKVLDEMPQHNIASVNATISGFAQNGNFKEALSIFKQVGVREIRPNSVTVASLLSAGNGIDHVSQIHCWAVKLGVENDVYVGTGIVTMYMAYKELVSATKVFEVMKNKSVVSYNAFICGLLQNGVYRIVLNVFKDLLQSQIETPNYVTLFSVLGACSNLHNLQFGRQTHGIIMKFGIDYDTMVGTALVDMYSKCGSCQLSYVAFKELDEKRNLITWNSMIAGFMLNGEFDTAVELFSQLDSEGLVADSATWNIMIHGFSQLGKGMEAFQFFRKMQSCGVTPSLKSLTSLLSAFSSLAALQSGKEIHLYAIRNGFYHDEFLATALIDMYMKCGQSTRARRVFDKFDIKPADPAFWNAMISGYGRNGEHESAFEVFDLMRDENVRPNHKTFLNVLSVCSHMGNIDRAWEVFKMMTEDYSLAPNPAHFSCLVDLLGRSGQLDKARELAEETPEPSASMISSLLAASGHHLDFALGKDMAEKLTQMDPENSAPFVTLSNIYAAMGRWEDVERIRHMMDVRRVKKTSGYSVEVT